MFDAAKELRILQAEMLVLKCRIKDADNVSTQALAAIVIGLCIGMIAGMTVVILSVT